MSDELENRLREAASRWRMAEPSIRDDILVNVDRRASGASRRLGALASMAIVAVAAIVLGFRFIGRDAAGGSLLVASGERVAGSGSIVADASGVRLCILADSRFLRDAAPVCSQVVTQLEGLDSGSLPEATVTGSTKWVPWVHLVGTWTGSSLRVDSIQGEAPPTTVAAAVPCPQPEMGWPNPSVTPLQEEQDLAHLEDLIGQAPESYGATWSGVVAVSGQQVSVQVVATTGDPSAIYDRLRAVFPLALCVTRVDFSSARLQDAADELSAAHPGWIVEVDPIADRVRVHLPLVNETVAGELESRPEVVADPLLRPLK